MKRLFTLSLVLLVLGFASISRAATFTAVANGDWSTGGTWDMGSRPNCGSTIIIPAGFTVTVTSIENYTTGCSTPMRIEVYGDLVFDGGKLKLPAGSEIYVYPGGRITEVGPGEGNSSTIEIGGDVVWNADSPPISGPSSLPEGLLPVELTCFKAKEIGQNKIQLIWQTVSETNNQFFTIERSEDGLVFEAIETTPGAGNSTGIKNYEFIDESAFSGTNYYRLKQTDFNGKFSYSGIEQITTKENDLSFNVYPNPSNGDVKIAIYGGNSESNDELILKICDVTGKVVVEKSFEYPNQPLKCNVRLNRGYYYVSLEADSYINIQELIVH